MFRTATSVALHSKHSRLPRSRSHVATRAILCAGCITAIICVLLTQFFILPASTTLDAPTAQATEAACYSNSAVNTTLCGDQQVGGRSSDQSRSTGTTLRASSAVAKGTTGVHTSPSAPDPQSDEWQNTIALCAMMKTEHAEDVLEWLEYHRWLGVDKVFLRENGDEVPEYLIEATKQHVDSGFLQLGTVPGQKHPNQNRWHNRCSQPDLAGAFSWIAYIDLDEFLILMDKGEAAEDPHLKEFLFKHRNAAGLSLQWLLFGSSGHRHRPQPGGPLRHFSTCTGELAYQMKCMASTYHLCSTPMLGDTVHDCAYRYESEVGLDGLNAAHPVILGDGDPVATHLTTVEAAIRASAAEKAALTSSNKPMKIGPKKVPPKQTPATNVSTGPPTPPAPTEQTSSTSSTSAAPSDAVEADAGQTTATLGSSEEQTHSEEEAPVAQAGAAKHTPAAWKFSDVTIGVGVQSKQADQQQKQAARSLLDVALTGDLVASIPDGRAGETVCRSYSGHLNERQHKTHNRVSQEKMLVLAHYVTRSFDDYISRKLPRPSGIYAHTFNRLSRSKSAAHMSNETLFDQFEDQQKFNGQDDVCSSIVRHKYAERCCGGVPATEGEQSAVG